MIYMINPKMAIIGTMIIPLSLLVTKVVVGKSQKLFKNQQDALGELNSTVTEMYTGYNEILLYNQQVESVEKFKKINENLKENALSKLKRKNLDYIVANDISAKDTGFGVEENKVIIISKDNKEINLEKMSKEKVARNLFDIILKKR